MLVAGWCVLLLWAAAGVSSSKELCSSMDTGPFCPFVNQLPVPKHFTREDKPPSSLQELLKQALEILEKQNKGAFQLLGGFHLQSGELVLRPSHWLQRPGEEWTMIGLQGTAQRRPATGEMEFGITLENGSEATGQCSPLRLKRVQRGFNRYAMFDGTFEAEYECSGRSTKAKLVLVTRRGNIQGIFSFQVQSPRQRLSDKTRAGCYCRKPWEYQGVHYLRGQCAKTDPADEASWCLIDRNSCTGAPAGQDWDWCNSEQQQVDPDQIVAVFHIDANGRLVQ
ncbi:hypothetical protein BASA82_000280 [Batrachochytrium salamandrivorans]|nr:hypothetical protein BASA81_002545 [Batrachochytrium salamandrivorans]KAH9262677.1 hypothetical protein BASA82_000280 [Batrachochytrium salamandrivorans]